LVRFAAADFEWNLADLMKATVDRKSLNYCIRFGSFGIVDTERNVVDTVDWGSEVGHWGPCKMVQRSDSCLPSPTTDFEYSELGVEWNFELNFGLNFD
jgi:hypothetical protein